MADASPEGTLNVQYNENGLDIFISPNISISDTLTVSIADEIVYSELVNLKPMQVFNKRISMRDARAKRVKVSVGRDRLMFLSDESGTVDDRVGSGTLRLGT